MESAREEAEIKRSEAGEAKRRLHVVEELNPVLRNPVIMDLVFSQLSPADIKAVSLVSR